MILVFPFCTDGRRLRLKQRWSRGMLDILGIRLDADLAHLVPGSMLVANHISWLDIFVVNAARPCAFVSKEEVRHWPVIGWLAAMNDTVFLKRGSRGHAKLINQEIAEILGTGKHVAVFPEGTTTDGTHLLHFHAALLQPALAAERPVVPAAISYWGPDGSRSLAPRYDGDLSLGDCLKAVLSRRRLTARLVATPAQGLNGEDRRTVAAAAHAAITAAAQLPPAGPKPLAVNPAEPSGSAEPDAARSTRTPGQDQGEALPRTATSGCGAAQCVTRPGAP